MAPTTNILLDFYGQTLENCRFVSHEDAEITIITSMDPASAKFRATVVRTEEHGRKKKRTVLVSEIGTSFSDVLELLHTKSAEAVQNHVTAMGYDVVPKKKGSKSRKHKSSAGKRWDDDASTSNDDSEASSSDSDDSDATQSTAHLSETSLSDDETVSVSPRKKSKKHSVKKTKAARQGPPPMPAWPSQPRMGGPPPPPGFPGYAGRGGVPPPGLLSSRMPRTDGPAIPPFMGSLPPKGMRPMSSAATLPSPPAPPVGATTASAPGPSGASTLPARPLMPFPPAPRAKPTISARAPAPAPASAAAERDVIVNISWAGHDTPATVFLRCPLSKKAIGQHALRYVSAHADQFGPERPSPPQAPQTSFMYLITDMILPAAGPEKNYSLQAYPNDDMSALCNSLCASGDVPRFEVAVVGRPGPPRPAAGPGPRIIDASSPRAPLPAPPHDWIEAWTGKARQTNRPETTYDLESLAGDE